MSKMKVSTVFAPPVHAQIPVSGSRNIRPRSPGTPRRASEDIARRTGGVNPPREPVSALPRRVLWKVKQFRIACNPARRPAGSRAGCLIMRTVGQFAGPRSVWPGVHRRPGGVWAAVATEKRKPRVYGFPESRSRRWTFFVMVVRVPRNHCSWFAEDGPRSFPNSLRSSLDEGGKPQTCGGVCGTDVFARPKRNACRIVFAGWARFVRIRGTILEAQVLRNPGLAHGKAHIPPRTAILVRPFRRSRLQEVPRSSHRSRAAPVFLLKVRATHAPRCFPRNGRSSAGS